MEQGVNNIMSDQSNVLQGPRRKACTSLIWYNASARFLLDGRRARRERHNLSWWKNSRDEKNRFLLNK
jgi:hypothetical protein